MAVVRVLVVGGGGFLGRHIVEACVHRLGAENVVALVRREVELSGARTVTGDARSIDFRLDPTLTDDLRRTVTHVICATGRFDTTMSHRDAVAEHVLPARGALAYAARCRLLESFTVVSSLLSIGNVTGPVLPDAMPHRPNHRNYYEWAKFEVEKAALAAGVPLRVIRAGHVLPVRGHEHSGSRPELLFAALPLLISTWTVPVDSSSVYWCAPVDWIASLVVAVSLAPDSKWVFAVDPASPTVGACGDAVAALSGIGQRRIRLPSPLASLVSLISPQAFGLDIPRELLAYLGGSLEPDLSTLREVCSEAVLSFPGDRRYVVESLADSLESLKALK